MICGEEHDAPEEVRAQKVRREMVYSVARPRVEAVRSPPIKSVPDRMEISLSRSALLRTEGSLRAEVLIWWLRVSEEAFVASRLGWSLP